MTSVLSATPYAKSATGLKAKPTYEQLIDYIRKDPDKIKYPDRRAKIMRNSFWLSQLDGEGWNTLQTQIKSEQTTGMSDLLMKAMADALGMNLKTLQTIADRLNMEAVPGPIGSLDRESQPYRLKNSRKGGEPTGQQRALPWYDDQRQKQPRRKNAAASTIWSQPNVKGRGGVDDNPIPVTKNGGTASIPGISGQDLVRGTISTIGTAGWLGTKAIFTTGEETLGALDLVREFGPEALETAWWLTKGIAKTGYQGIRLAAMPVDAMVRAYEWASRDKTWKGQGNEEDLGEDADNEEPTVILPFADDPASSSSANRKSIIRKLAQKMSFRRRQDKGWFNSHENEATFTKREEAAAAAMFEAQQRIDEEQKKKSRLLSAVSMFLSKTSTGEEELDIRINEAVRNKRKQNKSGTTHIDVEGVTWVDMTRNDPPTEDESSKRSKPFGVARPRWMKKTTFQADEAFRQEQAVTTGAQWVC